MGEKKRPIEIEGDQALPFGKGQLVDPGSGIRDDRTAADCIDEDVDPAKFLLDGGDRRLGLSRIEGVAKPTVSRAASAAQGGGCLIESPPMIVDADDDRTFARHDLG